VIQRVSVILALALIGVGFPCAAVEAGDVIAVKAGTVWTGAGATLAPGVVVIEKGRIVEVGPAGKVEVPDGARVIDLGEGSFVMPGLVDPYSRLGLFAPGASPLGARGSASQRFTSKAETNPTAELFPRQDVFKELREAGVTTLGLIPGSGGGITGTVSVIRPAGDTRAEMVLKEGVLLRIGFGGGSSAKAGLKTLLDRAKSEAEKVETARKKRAEWEKRQAAKRKKEEEKRKKEAKKKGGSTAAEDDKEKAKAKKPADEGPKVPEPEASIAPLIRARARELRVLLEVPGPGVLDHFFDVLDDRHELDLVLVTSGRTAVRVKDRLKARKIPVLLAPTLTTRPPTNERINPAAELEAAGIEFAFRPSRDGLSAIRGLFYQLGTLVKCGLGRESALKAVTCTPASWLGVSKEVGSLEKGKAANLIGFSGDPLASPLSALDLVILDGAVVLTKKP